MNVGQRCTYYPLAYVIKIPYLNRIELPPLFHYPAILSMMIRFNPWYERFSG
jgi:hypothetical protein